MNKKKQIGMAILAMLMTASVTACLLYTSNGLNLQKLL